MERFNSPLAYRRAAVLPSPGRPVGSRREAPASPAAPGRERITWLDVAKGVGILLVVMGHCLGGLRNAGLVPDASAGWFCFYLIYSFHMPLFFFLAGCLVEGRVAARPGHFLAADFTRIAYPYFLWGMVQTAVQILAAGVVNSPLALPPAEQLPRIAWSPPAQFWFLYALFFLHLAALAAFRAGGRVAFALAFAALLAVAAAVPPVADFIGGYVSGTNILFYVLGALAGGPLLAWRGRLARPWSLVAIGVIVFLSLVWLGWTAGLKFDSLATLPAAFAGSATALLLCRTGLLRENRWLAYIGRRALPIYVLHVLCVAGARIALVKLGHIAQLGLILPSIFIAGVAGPLLVDRAVRAARLSAVLGLP